MTSAGSSAATTPRAGSTTRRAGSTRGCRRPSAAGSAESRQSADTRDAGVTRGGRANIGEGEHRTRPDVETPALRLPGAQAPLRPLHARDGGAGLRDPAATFLEVARGDHSQLRPRAHDGLRYAVGWTHRPRACRSSGPLRSSSYCWATWAVPAAGSWRLRGHASIQGSTDISTLFNKLPGLLAAASCGRPSGARRLHRATSCRDRILGQYALLHRQPAQGLVGRCGHRGQRLSASTTSQDHRRPRQLPVGDGHDRRQGEGLLPLGENPAVGSANGRMQRKGLANLEWLVVRDNVDDRFGVVLEGRPGDRRGEWKTEDIGTEVFFMPAAAYVEKDGSFTNTQRLLQWHNKAVEPPGDCRSDLHFAYHLGRMHARPGRGVDGRTRPAAARSDLGLPDQGPIEEPSAEAVLAEITDTAVADRRPLAAYTRAEGRRHRRRAGAGSTAARTPTASTRPRAASPRASRSGSRPSGAGPGRTTGGCSTTVPPPIPRATRGASARSTSGGTRRPASGPAKTCRTSSRPSRRTTCRPKDARAQEAIAGTDPFIMQGGRQRLALRAERTGRRAAADALRAPGIAGATTRCTACRPTRRVSSTRGPKTPLIPAEVSREAMSIPFVITTFRLTEHHTAGGMSRGLPFLSELMPEMFVEVSPQLAALARARAWRMGDARHGSERDRSSGAGDRRAWRPDDRRSGGAPDRAALSLGRQRLGARRFRQRPAASALDANVHIMETKARPPTSSRAAGRGAGLARTRHGVPAAGRYHMGRGPDERGADLRSGAAIPAGSITRRGWAFSPTPRCASAVKRARSRARQWNCVPEDGFDARDRRMTTPVAWVPRPGATLRSSSRVASPAPAAEPLVLLRFLSFLGFRCCRQQRERGRTALADVL